MRLAFKVIIVLFAALVLSSAYMAWASSLENPSPVTTLNPQSSGPRAIVISDPGISDFETRVAGSFANGLVESGWSVDVTTASSQTPSNLTGYTLVVLSSPIYGGEPSKPLQNYIARVSSLQGIRVASVLTGAGSGEEARVWMTNAVQAKGGEDVLFLVVFSMAPNPVQYGSTDPFIIAASAAASLTP